MNKSILLSAVIIAALLISTSFLFSQNQNLKQEINSLNKKIEELQKVKPVVEKPPEGWKEYVDEEYKFRVWYPEEFTAYGETAEVIAYKFFDNKDNIQIVDFSMPLSYDAPIYLLYIYI